METNECGVKRAGDGPRAGGCLGWDGGAYCGRVPGLPLGWTIQSGVRGWTYLCAACTRSNLRSIESRLFDRDALRFGTAN